MTSVVLEVFLLVFRIVLSYIEVVVRFFVPRPRKSVESDVVLVTGAGHGIGRQLALHIGRLGAKVVLWDINKDGNDATADEINKSGGEATSYLCDVSKPDDVRRVAERVRKDVGEVTMLVNNAGILQGGALLSLEDSHIKRTFDVNTLAHFWTVRTFLPDMLKKNQGHIISIASMAATFGVAYLSDYASSKWAVFGFVESVRDEVRRLGKTGIKTSVVCPTFVDTGMTKFPKLKHDRMLDPSETAEVIVDGILREEEVIFVPSSLNLQLALAKILPRKAQQHIFNFLDTGIDAQFKVGEEKKVD